MGWLWLLAGLLGLAGLASLGRMRRSAVWLLTATICVALWAACGGGGGGGGSTAPSAVVTPSSLSFGTQYLNTTSASQTVTVSHTGPDLVISSATLGGPDWQDFMQGGFYVNCGINAPLGSGVNCPITVTFTPQAPGTRTATLTIVDNASNSPQTASLSGAGARPPTLAGTYPVYVSATFGSVGHNVEVDLNVQ